MKRQRSTDEEWYGAIVEKLPKVEVEVGDESLTTDGMELVDNDDPPQSDVDEFLPPCWNIKQYESFSKKYEGLIVQHKKLGCSTCAKVYYGCTQGTISVSREWGSCNVNAAGANKTNQQASLRKKMHDHFTSKKHKACAKQEMERLAVSTTTSTSNVGESISPTGRVFNTVYSLAKTKRSLHDIEDLIELQEKNGLDMGDTGLHCREAAVKIADHIANYIRGKVFNRVMEKELKFCIVIDEITTLLKTTFLVFLKIDKLAHLNIFFDLLEFENQEPSASSVYSAVLESFLNAGIDGKYLERHLIGVSMDGSNKIVGRQSQVGAQFEKNFADIVVWYGLNHGLQLSVDSFNNDVKHVINLINFDEISLLSATTLSSFMTITFTGLPLQLWDPQPAVKTWIEKHGLTAQGTSKDVKKDMKNYTFNQLAIWNLLE